MIIQEQVDLREYTTFKIGGPARFFCRITDEAELSEAIAFAKKHRLRIFILGGGSNILISDKGFPGLVVRIELKGVSYREEGDVTIVSAAAGEMWDDLVASAVERGLHGIENLSAIPGTVGAAPVQNIGAYGTEIAETIHSVRVFDRKKHVFKNLSKAECQFSYRESIFKADRRRYVITRVDLALSKDGALNTKYRDVADYFAKPEWAGKAPGLKDVRDAVIDIRWNKLPDWKLWGTAGSFFKNPTISERKWKKLAERYPGFPGYPDGDGHVKVPLGWVLDNVCDVKGLCLDGACIYEKQALVIVTQPGSTASQVVHLAKEIMKRVKKRTGISVTGEVEWVN